MTGKPSRRRTAKPAPSPQQQTLQSPLLGKGGAHGKTRKAERRAQKIRLRDPEA